MRTLVVLATEATRAFLTVFWWILVLHGLTLLACFGWFYLPLSGEDWVVVVLGIVAAQLRLAAAVLQPRVNLEVRLTPKDETASPEPGREA